MDLSMHKIQVINEYKKQQLLNHLILYSLTSVACSLFCSSPFWYPPLCATLNVFRSVSLPKIGSLFFSTKALFVLGNLIVIFLVGESKMCSSYSSPAGDVRGDDEYVDRSRTLRNISSFEDKGGRKLEKGLEEKVDNITCKEGYLGEEKTQVEKEKEEDFSFPAEQLNKMADDFIAKVNKQRRIEAGNMYY